MSGNVLVVDGHQSFRNQTDGFSLLKKLRLDSIFSTRYPSCLFSVAIISSSENFSFHILNDFNIKKIEIGVISVTGGFVSVAGTHQADFDQ
jgi:hypothetical protein